MKCILNKTVSEIKIEKSRFITVLSPVHSKEEIDTILSQVKEEYPNATHYCYAYMIGADQKCSDDGEPGGTAGMPMLNVLKNQNLDHIIGIVIRYFGGIKLGAGGLVRAYTKAMTTGLEHATVGSILPGILVQITFPYVHQKTIDHLLKDISISKKNYDTDIIYEIKLPLQKEAEFRNILFPYVSNYQVIKEIYIQKN